VDTVHKHDDSAREATNRRSSNRRSRDRVNPGGAANIVRQTASLSLWREAVG